MAPRIAGGLAPSLPINSPSPPKCLARPWPILAALALVQIVRRARVKISGKPTTIVHLATRATMSVEPVVQPMLAAKAVEQVARRARIKRRAQPITSVHLATLAT